MKLALRLSIITLLVLVFLSCNVAVTEVKYNVSVTQSTGGIITISPQKTSYSDGDQISVTATPNSGYVFSYWGGNISGAANPISFTVTGNTIISATFTALQNTFTINVNNSVGGAISLSPNKPNYALGEIVSVTALPTTGYAFSSWSGDLSGTTNPTTLTVTKNASISATFTQNIYSITVNATTGGTISLSPSNPTFTYGDTVTVTATPDSGYAFSSWGGNLSGTTNPMTVTVMKNMTISAAFTQTTFSITVNATTGGTISLSPNKTSYNAGDVVTVTATANSGYSFSTWSGDISGGTNPTTITVAKNTTIFASFAQITMGTYTITLSSTTGGMISISPNKTNYNLGDSVTIMATSRVGYIFSGWGGSLSGNVNPITVTISGNMIVSATFTPIAYTITLIQGTGGNIALSPNKSSYTYGESVIVAATPNSGYSFSLWGGNIPGSANPTTISVSGNMTISASFVRNTYSITVNQSVGGTITLSPNNSSYYSGDSVTVTATPNAGYIFSSWGGDLTGSTNPTTITVSGNMSLSAVFTQIAYTVTLSEATGGSIALSSNQSSYHYGDSVTVTATANSGFSFSSWGGSLSGSVNPITISVSGNMTISASFVRNTYSITVNQSAGGTITLSPNNSFYYSGDSVTITAIPNNGYAFSFWGGNLSGSVNPKTFTISGNMTVSATFAPIAYTITLIQGMGGTISVSPSKPSYSLGDSVTVTATASSGYIFSSWGGDLTGSINPQSFTISKNMSITGFFTPTYSILQSETFDTYASGSPPVPPWADYYYYGSTYYTRSQADGMGVTIRIDESVYRGASGKSIHFLDSSGTVGSTLKREMTQTTYVRAEYYMRNSNQSYEGVTLQFYGDRGAEVEFACFRPDGYIWIGTRYGWVTSLLQYSPNTWYYVRRELDMTTGLGSFYVQQDGNPANSASYQIGSDSGIGNTYLNYIGMDTGNGPWADCYIDEIVVSNTPVSSGSIDPTFGTSGKTVTPIGSGSDTGTSMAIQQDGKIIVTGFAASGASKGFGIARYSANGSIDSTFGTAGKVITYIGSVGDEGNAVVLQSDGKIVVVGSAKNGGVWDVALARYDGGGNLDGSFGSNGKTVTSISGGHDYGNGAVIQTDGKILVGGQSSFDLFAARYDNNGNLDTSFGTSGIVITDMGGGTDDNGRAIALQLDGKILVAGGRYNPTLDFAVVRYNANGTLDTSFGTGGMVTTPIGNGNEIAMAIAIQPDGKILLAGYSDSAYFALARYTSFGTLDTTFGSTGKVTTSLGTGAHCANAIALQTDGKILIAGSYMNGTNMDVVLVRYTSDGLLDTSFGNGGVVKTAVGTGNDYGTAISLQSDGKILVAGYTNNGSDDDFLLIRYLQ